MTKYTFYLFIFLCSVNVVMKNGEGFESEKNWVLEGIVKVTVDLQKAKSYDFFFFAHNIAKKKI